MSTKQNKQKKWEILFIVLVAALVVLLIVSAVMPKNTADDGKRARAAEQVDHPGIDDLGADDIEHRAPDLVRRGAGLPALRGEQRAPFGLSRNDTHSFTYDLVLIIS